MLGALTTIDIEAYAKQVSFKRNYGSINRALDL